MNRALAGKSGTMTGRDSANRDVLAAYEPILFLGIGIVAKIDMAELRAPFLRAAGISGIGAVLILLLGTALFRRVSSPLMENLEQNVARLTEAQGIARLGNFERNIITGEGWWSDETYRIFGLGPATPEQLWKWPPARTAPGKTAPAQPGNHRSATSARRRWPSTTSHPKGEKEFPAWGRRILVARPCASPV
jgi:hypothetical protein